MEDVAGETVKYYYGRYLLSSIIVGKVPLINLHLLCKSVLGFALLAVLVPYVVSPSSRALS